MKNIIGGLAVLFTVAFAFVSCIKDKEVAVSPECAILSFSVGDITSLVPIKNTDGTDTLINRVISGKSIFFNIDQVNGVISNVDSLPDWVNLTRVVPSFVAYGNVFYRPNGQYLYYSLTSGSDSIDLSEPTKFVVVGTDGVSAKYYDVNINRSNGALDTLAWKKADGNGLAVVGPHKTLADGKKVFVFFSNGSKTVLTTSDGAKWSTPVSIEGTVTDIDYNSILRFKERFYALDCDGSLYSSVLGIEWEKVTERKFAKLLAADSYYLYVLDNNTILGTSDFESWIPNGTTDLDMLPNESTYSFCYPARTNANIQVAVMGGLTDANQVNGVNWYKVTSPDDGINQPWSYMQVTSDNPFGMPRLKNLSVTCYKNALYAIGMNQAGKYPGLYRSQDNGLTWQLQARKYALPADLDSANGYASITSVGDELWIVQEGGRLWKGVIR